MSTLERTFQEITLRYISKLHACKTGTGLSRHILTNMAHGRIGDLNLVVCKKRRRNPALVF